MTILSTILYLATVALSGWTGGQAADPMIGAWGGPSGRADLDTELVVIFSEKHQVAAWYLAESGEVVHTNGGLWSREGLHVTEVVEFDSDNPERVGSSVSFDVELTDTSLAIVGAPIAPITRIDHGDALAGAWEVFEVTSGSGWVSTESDPKTVRVMSGTRYQEITYDPKTGRIASTTGGVYSFDEDGYVETPAFGTSIDLESAGARRFAVARDGDTWRQIDAHGVGRAWRRR